MTRAELREWFCSLGWVDGAFLVLIVVLSVTAVVAFYLAGTL
jgi:hypothetical protein